MKFSTRILSALLSAFLAIIIPILVAIVVSFSSTNGHMLVGFLYISFILFLPLVFVVFVSNKIINWLFLKLRIEKLKLKLGFTFGLTLFIAVAYILITSLFFGTVRYVFRETWAILGVGMLAILLDTFFFHHWMEKKEMVNEPLDQNLEL